MDAGIRCERTTRKLRLKGGKLTPCLTLGVVGFPKVSKKGLGEQTQRLKLCGDWRRGPPRARGEKLGKAGSPLNFNGFKKEGGKKKGRKRGVRKKGEKKGEKTINKEGGARREKRGLTPGHHGDR